MIAYLTRFCIIVHNHIIEISRCKNPKEIPMKDRICDPCDITEDVYHFGMQRKKYDSIRQKCVKN